MVKSIDFDDCVLAGLDNQTRDVVGWQLQVPADIRSQIVAIVEAPNWHDLPRSTTEKIPSLPTKSERLDFVRFQKGIAETFRITVVMIAIASALLVIWLLYRIDDRYFGGNDSLVVALIRAGTILTFPAVIWITWCGWRLKQRNFYKIARCMRGFLARNLSPLWVSWLYASKRMETSRPSMDQPEQTMKQAVANNWPLLALFLICILFLANTGWLEGQYNVDSRGGKASWVNYVVQWLFQHPTSTLFIAAPLGSLSVSVFTYRLMRITHLRFAAAIAIVIFIASILLFAASGAV